MVRGKAARAQMEIQLVDFNCGWRDSFEVWKPALRPPDETHDVLQALSITYIELIG